MDLSQLRQQIDTIDRQIVNLYEERMDVSRQVAEYKIETAYISIASRWRAMVAATPLKSRNSSLSNKKYIYNGNEKNL